MENGDKAKITLRFRGREMAHQQLGMDMMKRIEADLAELAQVEQFPKMEGRQMIMVLAPAAKRVIAEAVRSRTDVERDPRSANVFGRLSGRLLLI